MALVNQQAVANGESNIGFVNPASRIPWLKARRRGCAHIARRAARSRLRHQIADRRQARLLRIALAALCHRLGLRRDCRGTKLELR
jgi:hypothetical protein